MKAEKYSLIRMKHFGEFCRIMDAVPAGDSDFMMDRITTYRRNVKAAIVGYLMEDDALYIDTDNKPYIAARETMYGMPEEPAAEIEELFEEVTEEEEEAPQEEPEVFEAVEPEKEEEKKPKKAAKTPPKQIDHGKIRALILAGWNPKDIAWDVGVTKQHVYQERTYMRKEGIL